MPLFSVLVAMYNVEEYVEATLKSLRGQSIGFRHIEVIIVDDGSTDGSPKIAQDWAELHPNIIYLRQENQGAGAARKTALAHATAPWVTVVDPDDILDRDYFKEAQIFIERDANNSADMLISNVLILNDETGRFSDTHPLRYRFKHGTRLVSLNDEPTCIQLGATAFLQRKRLIENGLTYDVRIEPTFEDAHLLGRYLSLSTDPVIGVIPKSRYYYRKRIDNSSLVQSSWSRESRYSTVLELGYLDLLTSTYAKHQRVPEWMQNMVLYDLIWYFKEDAQQHSKTAWISGELQREFLNSLKAIFKYIDENTISNFAINNPWWSMRETILSYFKDVYLAKPGVYQWGKNSKNGNNQYCILYSGIAPEISVYANGRPVKPSNDTYTVHRYFSEPMLVERNFSILEPGNIRIECNGLKIIPRKPQTAIKLIGPAPAKYRLNEPVSGKVSNAFNALVEIAEQKTNGRISIAKINSKKDTAAYLRRRIQVESLTTGNSIFGILERSRESLLAKKSNKELVDSEKLRSEELKRQANSPEVVSRFKNAWVLIDHPDRADDNAEHLYRYLSNDRPDINSYFLLSKESPDWERLATEGFRLVEYGSDESVLLLLNARVRASSDAVASVMYPINRKYYDLHKSKFIFLQHGVTMNDLSRWLNPKKIDGIICATRDEYEWFAGVNSPYTIKKSNVYLTGFPRFDRLYTLREESSSLARRLTIMPTWRQYLRDQLASASTDEDRRIVFKESTFGQHWMQLLKSPALRNFAEVHNLEINFMAHPALSEFIEALSLPEYVRIARPEVEGFQTILSDSACLVTDYSSVAFDAASIGVPILYYQFDRLDMFSGMHNVRKGYYDFAIHGFGPVSTNIAEFEQDILKLSGSARLDSIEQYEERTARAFPHKDSENSSRVTEAILEVLSR